MLPPAAIPSVHPSWKRWLPTRIPRLDGILSVEELVHVTTGRERFIYRLKSDETKLAKILRPDAIMPRSIFPREYRADRDTRGLMPAIPKIYGVQQTEIGPALISDAVLSPDGALAPNLRQLEPEGSFSDELLVHINALISECYDYSLPVYDLSPMNIVFGGTSRSDRQRLYIVDGFGDRNVIPLKALFPWVNSRHLDKKLPNLERYTDLLWDPVARAYSNGPHRASWRQRRAENRLIGQATPPPEPGLDLRQRRAKAGAGAAPET